MTKLPAVNNLSTKKEILDAYNLALDELTALEGKLLNAEKELKKKKELVTVQSSELIIEENFEDGLEKLQGKLAEFIADTYKNLNEKKNQLTTLQEAIKIKENELKEIYSIEKQAATLAALIEANNKEKQEFDLESKDKKEQLSRDISETRKIWEEEKNRYDLNKKELIKLDQTTRARLEEDFKYEFDRKKKLAENKLADELEEKKKKVEEALNLRERKLTDREAKVAELETELENLRKRVSNFDTELDKAIKQAVKDTTEKVQLSMEHKIELLENQKQSDSKILSTKIQALEEKVKEQAAYIKSLTDKLDTSYEKVQHVAVKAIESASKFNYQGLQDSFSDQKMKNSSQEKN